MKKIIIAITVPAAIISAVSCVSLAQEMKAPPASAGPYSALGIDVQCYEIKYDPNSQEYLAYYRVIREKIMQKLRGLYRYHYRNGDVYLYFTLNSDGRLDSFDVDYSRSVQDKKLIEIATTSLKRSSPFPKFPKEITSPEVSFSVVISFKDK
jgi:hypothetical protein